MEVFSTDIQRKKIMFINNVQAMLLQSERVSEMHFQAIQRPKFHNLFPSLSILQIPHGDSKLSKLENTEWGKAAVGKSAWIKACLHM